MILKVVNEDKSVTDWIVHVFRDSPLVRQRNTIVVLHTGECPRPRKLIVGKKQPCRIATGDAAEYRGVAYLNPKDQFSVAEGRKVAFTHAIASMPREQRARMWAAYYKQVKMPAKA